MSSEANGGWVRQGTPRDDNADWNQEQSEYGTAISPVEWDEPSHEHLAPPTGDQSGSAESPAELPAESVPGQEPDAEREYRSDEVDPFTLDEPVGDADDDGVDPARLDEPSTNGTHDVVGEPDYEALPVDEGQEMTRPRPLVPDALEPNNAAGEPTSDDQDTDTADPAQERHLEAADYLAVDPEPFSAVYNEGVVEDAEPTQHVADDDTESTQYVETGDTDSTQHVETVDTDPTQHVETVDTDPTQHVETDDSEPTHHMDTDDSEATPHMDTDDEPTQYVNTDDMESTQVAPPAAGAAGAAGATTASSDPLSHRGEAEETAIIREDAYPSDAAVEEERRRAQLAMNRQDERPVAVVDSSQDAVHEERPARVTTDRFFPSLGLFVLRIVLAGILGIASFQILRNGVDATAEFLGTTLIPEPRLVAWILGFTLGAMALLLVIGLLQRVVGLLLLAVAVGSLVFIRWGNHAIFDMSVEGFIGDKDLLLAAVGLVLLTIGGGAWGIDGAFRRARKASRTQPLD